MKTKFTIVLILLAFLQACGDDGSSSTQKGKHYPVKSSFISRYEGGEHLKYNYTFKRDEKTLSQGIEDTYIYSGYSFSATPQEAYKQVTYLSGEQGVSTTNFFFYDDNGHYIHFTTGEDNWYVNQQSPATGAMAMPAHLSPGYSWTNDPVLMFFDGSSYDGSMSFTIISRETILVPIGGVECFKISYSGSFLENWSSTHKKDLEIIGTMWVNPQIGIIKNSETIETTYFGIVSHYYFMDQLVSINWDI